DRLMMHAVDEDRLFAEASARAAAAGNIDRVHEPVAGGIIFRWEVIVLHRGGDLLAHVLIERTAERDVDHLKAAANGPDRLLVFHRPANQLNLDCIARGIDAATVFGLVFAVTARVNVDAAG